MEDDLALWGHRFAIAIPVRWPLDVLVLTVREHRTEGEDALLGSVRVDASTLLPISFKEGEKPPEAPILRFPLSFEKGLSVPVKKRDLNRKGLVKRGKNFRRPSWEQAEIETKRKRPSSSRSFDEQLELERYAEEDDLQDPASPLANHLSRVTYDEVKEEPDEESYAAVWKSISASSGPYWLRRAVRNRHRHAIEQVSRRWRGGRRGDSGRTRRKFDFHTGMRSSRTWTSR